MSKSRMNCTTMKCHYCGLSKNGTKRFLAHLTLHHEYISNFSVRCHVCGMPYTKVDSLRRHYYRKHPECVNEPQRDEQHGFANDEDNHVDDNVEEEQNDDPKDHAGTTLDELSQNLQRHIILFVLKMQENHLLPQLVQEKIVMDIRFILQEFRQYFCEAATSEITHQGWVMDENSDFHNILQSPELFESVFKTCSSTFKLQKYCEDHLGAILPRSYELPLTINNRSASFQYVPLLETLQRVLSTGEILNSILSEKQGSSKNFVDYTSGSEFRKHPVFSRHRICLRLHFFIDDYEVINPLGSKKSIHKLCGVYFTLGNLGPKFTSKLKYIFLSVLCRSHHLQSDNVSYQYILKPLIEDLKKLAEEGLSVNVNGHEMKIFGAVATVSADNLGAHQLGGFTKSFSSGRVCRHCMILYNQLNDFHSEDECQLRNKTTHAYHLDLLRENPELAKSTYGVSSQCALQELPYFSTVDHFAPDIMHDFLEGVVPVLIKLVLTQCIQQRYVSHKEINEKIKSFCYGRNDKKSKPVEIPSKCVSGSSQQLPGKAIEKWCLFRILPFLIQNHIPNNDKFWLLYLMCRQISDKLFAPVIGLEDVEELEILIPSFLHNFIELFPGEKLKPKFHYLIHYPTQIRKLGPLRHLWCMRFEGKHQYFKRLANQLSNFRNVAFSLAKRHQLRSCWELLSEDFLERDAIQENVSTKQFFELQQRVQNAILHYTDMGQDSIEENEMITTCKTLRFNAVHYSVDDSFVIDLVHAEDIPVFFKIREIVNFRSKWLLFGCIYIASRFISHIHAYQVESINNWCVVEPGREIDYHGLDMYQIDEGYFIALHHKVCRCIIIICACLSILYVYAIINFEVLCIF